MHYVLYKILQQQLHHNVFHIKIPPLKDYFGTIDRGRPEAGDKKNEKE